MKRSTGAEAISRIRRVLVIEDNLDAVHTTCMLLRDMGHMADYAINGYVALEAARRFRPEFILLDLGLPGMTGFEVFAQIRRDPELVGVKIIAVTAYGEDKYRERAKELGFDGYFTKPLHPAELTELFGDLSASPPLH
jgi:CheY-like chemotaxis protein